MFQVVVSDFESLDSAAGRAAGPGVDSLGPRVPMAQVSQQPEACGQFRAAAQPELDLNINL